MRIGLLMSNPLTCTSMDCLFSVIGCGVIVFGYMELAFWQIAAYRQTQRIRVSLFQSILRQEIGWFDVHEIGELNTRLSE